TTCRVARRRWARRSGSSCRRPAPGWTSRSGRRRPRSPPAYYLHASGRLSLDAEPGDAPSGTFVYDPADPTPSAGGPLLQPPGKQVDNAAIESRADVLTYTTEPLDADQDLVGPVSARIFVRTETEYADVFVRLCDVDDKGVSRNVVDGIRRLSPDTVP